VGQVRFVCRNGTDCDPDENGGGKVGHGSGGIIPLRAAQKVAAPRRVPETDIAGVIGIDPKTLRRHYRDELKHGHAKANVRVAESLYRKATSDAQSVTAAIFWLKTRAGWKETSVQEVEPIQVVISRFSDPEPAAEGSGRRRVITLTPDDVKVL
jgi:hypothetical protein